MYDRVTKALMLDADPTEDETPELAALLRDAVMTKAKLTALIDDLELELAARMETDQLPIPGIGQLSRTREVTSRWKDKGAGEELRHDIKEAIARRLAANIRTGEMDEMTRGVVRLAIDAAYEVIPAFSSVKQPARKLGVDIEDYRDFGVRYRVQVLPEGVADE